MPNLTPKSLTVRLTPEIYQAAADIARERSISMNTLISESLLAEIEAADERARYDDYTLLGQDPECNVDYALEAQAEVMLRDKA